MIGWPVCESTSEIYSYDNAIILKKNFCLHTYLLRICFIRPTGNYLFYQNLLLTYGLLEKKETNQFQSCLCPPSISADTCWLVPAHRHTRQHRLISDLGEGSCPGPAAHCPLAWLSSINTKKELHRNNKQSTKSIREKILDSCLSRHHRMSTHKLTHAIGDHRVWKGMITHKS